MKYTLTEKQLATLQKLMAQMQQANATLKEQQQKTEAFLSGLGFEAEEGTNYSISLEGNDLEIK